MGGTALEFPGISTALSRAGETGRMTCCGTGTPLILSRSPFARCGRGFGSESGDVGRVTLEEALNAGLSGFGIAQGQGGMGYGRMCAGEGRIPPGC